MTGKRGSEIRDDGGTASAADATNRVSKRLRPLQLDDGGGWGAAIDNTTANAASVAVPVTASTDAEHMSEEAVQELVQSYGLLIVERDDIGRATWMCCKLCPIFGCKTRKAGYIMAYVLPFDRAEIEKHLKKEHPDQWSHLTLLRPTERPSLLQGKQLPSADIFKKRVVVLKSSWGDKGERRKISQAPQAQTTPTSQAGPTQALATGPSQPSQPLSRTRVQPNLVVNPSILHMYPKKNWEPCPDLPESPLSPLPMSTFPDLIPEDPAHVFGTMNLQKYSSRGYYDEDIGVMDLVDAERIFVEDFNVHGDIVKCIVTGPLREPDRAQYSAEQLGFRQFTLIVDNVESDAFELIMGPQDMTIAMRVLMMLQHGNSLEIASSFVNMELEAADEKVLARTVPTPVMVSRFGNAICCMELEHLRQEMSAMDRNWALVLTSKRCPELGEFGIEILVSYLHPQGYLGKTHLIGLQDTRDAGALTAQMLDVVCQNWDRRLIGLFRTVREEKPRLVEDEMYQFLCGRCREGREVMRLSKRTTPKDWPIYPWTFSAMSEEEFIAVLDVYQEALTLFMSADEIQCITAQRTELCHMKPPKEVDEKHLSFQASWANCESRAPHIKILANGLRLLWTHGSGAEMKYGQGAVTPVRRIARETAVNSKAERMLFARSLFNRFDRGFDS